MRGTLGRKLRVLRAERGINQETAARYIGVTPETLSGLERDRRKPYGPTLSKLSKFYGVPVDELIEVDDSPEEDPGVQAGLKPETEALVYRDMDEFVASLSTLSDDALLDTAHQLMLLVRYRYSAKTFETRAEMIAYMESDEKARGDKASKMLGAAAQEYEDRTAAVIEDRRKSLTPA